MYAKIQITGKIEVQTGMHIGGSNVFSPIGAVDAPVIKDARTNLPIIPGSSLKGKIRTLLAKVYNEQFEKKPDNDVECLTRLFGCAKTGNVKRSRILIFDSFLLNEEELRNQGMQSMTEIKFENTINRATAVANPRQIERVFRGSLFGLDMIYEAEKEDEILDDLTVLAEGMELVQYDYLGGNGSRGYGKVAFRDITASVVIGTLNDASVIRKCNERLQHVVRIHKDQMQTGE